jgi:hypothetical protein
MSPGHANDVRLDAKALAERLDVTPRHLARIPGLPRPHYVAGLKRYWLSEIVAWEQSVTTTSAPAPLHRGDENLHRGRRPVLTGGEA